MALKITRAADPIQVDRLNVVLYGPPGLAKTSVAYTAERPLLLDFDNGSHRAFGRKDTVRVQSWADVSGISRDDVGPFATVVIDTAGRALDALTADIIRTNPKAGRDGSLTLQGYGTLKARFTAFLKHLNSFGLDTVLIAHSEEKMNGDEMIERLDVQGGSKGEIFKAADAMGRLVLANGRRELRFSPTDAAFGKNPAQLPPLEVPHFTSPEFDGFLGRVIAQTKAKLNELSEEQKAAVEAQTAFRAALDEAQDADGINSLLSTAEDGGQPFRAMLKRRADQLELSWSQKAKRFEMARQAA